MAEKQQVTGHWASIAGSGSTYDLTIYGDQTIVEETRTFDLHEGANEVMIQDINPNFVDGSMVVLTVEGAGEIVVQEMNFRAANFNLTELLRRSIFNELTLWPRHTTSGTKRSCRGTLLHVLNDKLILKRSRQPNSKCSTVIVDINDYELGLPNGVPEGLSDKNSLVLTINASASDRYYQARLLYAVRGIAWEACHVAFYDQKRSMLTRFESWAKVGNVSGGIFVDANITLADGNLENQDPYGNVRAQSFSLASAGAAPNRPGMKETLSTTIGDVNFYNVPDARTLAHGQNKEIPLALREDVPIKREYFVPPDGQRAYRGGNQEPSLQPASIRLKWVNDGPPLPEGPVKILQSSGADGMDLFRITGKGNLESVATGEPIGLTIGTSSEVKFMRRWVEEKEISLEPEQPGTGDGGTIAEDDVTILPAQGYAAMFGPSRQQPETEGKKVRTFLDNTWEITVKNFNTENEIEVIVVELFPARSEIVETTHPFTRESGIRFYTAVKLAAGGKEVLRYTIRTQQD